VGVVLERDALGQVVRKRHEAGAKSYEVESRYDEAGQRIERQTDLGHRVEYAWDRAGELTGLRAGPSLRLLSAPLVSLRLPLLEMPDWEMTIARDPVGLELARRMPGGVVAIWKRDGFGRPALRHVLTGARAEPRDGGDARRVPVASVILSRNDDVRDAGRRRRRFGDEEGEGDHC
jgi:YD repeat-containing protein